MTRSNYFRWIIASFSMVFLPVLTQAPEGVLLVCMLLSSVMILFAVYKRLVFLKRTRWWLLLTFVPVVSIMLTIILAFIEKPQEPIDTSIAHRQGYVSYKEGLDVKENPYDETDKENSQAWILGWIEAGEEALL